MQVSPYTTPSNSTYLLQRPHLTHVQNVFFPQCKASGFTPMQKGRQTCISPALYVAFLAYYSTVKMAVSFSTGLNGVIPLRL
jgi:hypothetical protein